MNIHSEKYHIAPLNSSEKAVEVIQEAEDVIAELTGTRVTLIAYEKKEENQGQ